MLEDLNEEYTLSNLWSYARAVNEVREYIEADPENWGDISNQVNNVSF
ncbi:MAG: hypothetical protein RLZ12_645 [Bacillota bacterium]|jgi:hypothetical protein